MPSDVQAVEPAADLSSQRPPGPLEEGPYEIFRRNKNFASLNGTRCLCCLAVINEHVKWNLPGPRLLDMGFLGVDLFFVISGFLIVTLLIRERERLGTVNLRKFYTRRSLRIFPIYYLLILTVLFVYLALYPWKPDGLRYYAPAFPVLLTYTQDIIRAPLGLFYACWTLSMEEQFYLFWPTVEKFATRPVRWLTLGGLLFLSELLDFRFFDGLIERIYGDPAAVRMPAFLITFTPILLGVLLAYLMNERKTFGVLYRVIGHRWSPFFFVGILLVFCELEPYLGQGWRNLGLHLIFALILGSLVIREDHFARRILTFPLFARLGVISYGIYLYHTWIMAGVVIVGRRLHLNPDHKFLEFAAVTIATVLVAEASFRLIEQPLLRIKERFQS